MLFKTTNIENTPPFREVLLSFISLKILFLHSYCSENEAFY